MIYVLDTSSLSIILGSYYLETFESFWDKFDAGVEVGGFVSVHESKLELQEKFAAADINRLMSRNADFFPRPTIEEMAFVTDIYSVPHFRHNLERKKLLQGGAFADPFIMAKAKVLNGTVITEEKLRKNAAKIPNICGHFRIECVCLKEFLVNEDWKV